MCVQANRSPTRDTRPVISTSETAAPSSRATKRARRRPTLSGARPVAGYTIVPRLEIISSLSTSPARRSRIAPAASAGSHVSRKRSTPTVVRGTAALTAAPYDQWGRDVAVPDGRSDPLRGGTVDGWPVSYTHLRAHETRHDLVCRLLLEEKN